MFNSPDLNNRDTKFEDEEEAPMTLEIAAASRGAKPCLSEKDEEGSFVFEESRADKILTKGK